MLRILQVGKGCPSYGYGKMRFFIIKAIDEQTNQLHKFFTKSFHFHPARFVSEKDSLYKKESWNKSIQPDPDGWATDDVKCVVMPGDTAKVLINKKRYILKYGCCHKQ